MIHLREFSIDAIKKQKQKFIIYLYRWKKTVSVTDACLFIDSHLFGFQISNPNFKIVLHYRRTILQKNEVENINGQKSIDI